MARLTNRHWMEAEKSGFSRTWKPSQELDSFSPLSCSKPGSFSIQVRVKEEKRQSHCQGHQET